MGVSRSLIMISLPCRTKRKYSLNLLFSSATLTSVFTMSNYGHIWSCRANLGRCRAFRPFSPYNGVLRESVPLRSFLRLAAHIQMMPVLESGEETLVGGQAVIEGVMMRAPHSYCVAVRKASGRWLPHEMPVPRMSEKYRLFKYPGLRGLGVLGQAMSLGIKALRFSANAAMDSEAPSEAKPKEISSWTLGLNILFSFAFFIFLYKLRSAVSGDVARQMVPGGEWAHCFQRRRWSDPAGDFSRVSVSGVSL